MEYVQKIISFILANRELIAVGLFGIVELIVFLVKKRPLDAVKTSVMQLVVKLILEVEKIQPEGHGPEKKKVVMEGINAWLKENFPQLVGHYDGFVSELIETILTTPVKKGE